MTTMRWFRAGATPRGTPAFRRFIRRRPAVFLALAIAALSQTGCQSGPFGCGTCGGFGRRVRNASEVVLRPVRNAFRPVAAGAPCCGGGGIGAEAAPINYGPGTIVSPGPILGAPAGSSLSAPTESLPSNLEPIPSATPGPPPSGSGPASEATPTQGAKPSTSKTNYEAFRNKSGQGQSRTRALARPAVSGTESTGRSAQRPKPSPPAPNATDSDPLDNLPPIELPADFTLNEQKSSSPSSSSPAGSPAREAAAFGNISPLAAKAAEAVPPGANIAPGIRRFGGVESKLAGGSLPDTSGLDWLVEKGYKTVLDLREDSDLTPQFVSEVARRGLRYVALPLSVKTVDQEHVSRFQFEISLADARPLFFCDNDGTRAGVMWYIRRVTVDKVDPLIARRDAEELGLNDTKFWRAAETYLETWKASLNGGLAPVPAAPSEFRKLDPAPVPAPAPAPAPKAQASAPASTSIETLPVASLINDAERVSPGEDEAMWKPFAAMVVTGLGVPLAYMSRSAFPFKSIARASLPGPRQSRRALPSSSDG